MTRDPAVFGLAALVLLLVVAIGYLVLQQSDPSMLHNAPVPIGF